MILEVAFKTPDAVGDALDNEVQLKYGMSLTELEDEYCNCSTDDPSFEEKKRIYDEAKAEVDKMDLLIGKHVKYGEYVTIQFNTDENTVKVI